MLINSLFLTAYIGERVIVKILVVDDDRLFGYSLKDALEKKDEKVFYVETGEEALEKIEEESFDLVITDYNMPGMDGLELIKEAKKIAAETKFILMSGHGTSQLEKEALAAGASYFFSKPFDIEEMLEMVLKGGG